MKKLLKSYKTEINPTDKQKQLINQNIGVCRFIYNFYLSHSKKIYDEEKRFVSGYEFSKWLNNDFIPNNIEYNWIKKVSSKAVKQSILNAEKAFKNFFNKKAGFPKFKKKNVSDVKMHFIKTDKKAVILCERHRIKIPTLGWIRLKEKGHIPTNPGTHIIRSGAVSHKAGRYYVSVLVDETDTVKPKLKNFGLGIDLGVKNFAVVSSGKVMKNINKTLRLKKLEKKLKREQRCLSRKYEDLKKRFKIKKGETTRQNIQKQKLRVQKLYHRIDNIRTNYINKCVSMTVKTKPSYITIENLNVSGMMKNRHLSKAIAAQKFFEFRTKLTMKCKEFGIELRIADRWLASSKKCHNCGSINKSLKLSDRIYNCKCCGYKADRDFNASLNLRDTKTYEIAQ